MDLIPQLKEIVKNAGDAILESYGKKVGVSQKDDGSPVTAADLAANAILMNGLSVFGWPVLSEESVDDLRRLNAEKVWIIDPMDGTKDFIDQTDEFCVMVGLVEGTRTILGIIYQPTMGTFYYAEKGKGAFLQKNGKNPTKLKVSSTDDFGSAKMLMSRHHLLPAEMEVAHKLGVKNTVLCGSAGVKVGLIAAGQADLYLTLSGKTSEWDTCAPDIILHEAGGIMTDVNGNRLTYNKEIPRNTDGFVASNGILHGKIVATTQKIFN
ncbi:MAG: 3'(2'),5'-bisphosphate nucleotidase CysQ [Patescibacteria group bacterium]